MLTRKKLLKIETMRKSYSFGAVLSKVKQLNKFLYLKWGLGAGSTFLLDNFIYFFCFEITNSVLISNTISIFCATIYNFFFHKLITFENYADKFLSVRYLIFVLVSYLLSTMIIFLLNIDIDNNLVSKPISSIIVLFLNLYIMKYYVFRLTHSKE
jgi:putative flippase GtrA